MMQSHLRTHGLRQMTLSVCVIVAVGWLLSVLTGCEVDRIKFNRLDEGRRFLAAGEPFQAAKYFEESMDREKETYPIALAHAVVAYDQASKRVARIPAERQKHEQRRDELVATLRQDEDAIAHLVSILEYHNMSSQSAIDILIMLGADGSEALIRAYRTLPVERETIRQIFTAIGEPVTPAIKEAIASGTLAPEDVAPLVRLLGAFEIESMRDYLRSLRNNPSLPEGVRVEAAGALYRCGDKDERAYLFQALDSNDVLARRAASHSMAFLNDEPAASILIEHLDDDDAIVRLSLVRALGMHRSDASAVDALVRVIRQDENNNVANAAAVALSNYGVKALEPSLDALTAEADWTRRQRFVRVLSQDAVRIGFDQDLEYRLFEHYDKRERNAQVQRDIAELLGVLENAHR